MIEAFAVRVHDGTFTALMQKPGGPPAPAIVNVPAIFGVTDEAQRWLRDDSARGFLTIVYDPFWRVDPGPLSPLIDEERARATARRSATDPGDATADLAAVIEAVRAMPECNGKIAVCGYCFGGRFALIAAAELPIDAAVSYHGILLERSLEAGPKVRVPMQIHVGDNDPSCPIEAVEAIRAATAANPNIVLNVMPGIGHSFTWRNYHKFDEAAATRSETRAFAMLDTLKS